MQFPGLYVRESRGDKYYGMKYSQAAARARHLADEYKRGVDVFLRDVAGNMERVLTAMPYSQQSGVRFLNANGNKVTA